VVASTDPAPADPDPSVDPARIERARVELARLLGAGEVLDDPLALALYSRDASMIEGACSLVAFPRDREQVAGCLAIAERHGLAVVPRGSGTGLAGGSTPMAGALVLVTTKMDRVLEVRPEDLLAGSPPGTCSRWSWRSQAASWSAWAPKGPRRPGTTCAAWWSDRRARWGS